MDLGELGISAAVDRIAQRPRCSRCLCPMIGPTSEQVMSQRIVCFCFEFVDIFFRELFNSRMVPSHRCGMSKSLSTGSSCFVVVLWSIKCRCLCRYPVGQLI